jgi:hypothetical protein
MMKDNLLPEQAPASYAVPRNLNVVVPMLLARTLDSEREAAGEIWTALQMDKNPDGSDRERGSSIEAFIRAKVSAPPHRSLSESVQELNATQLGRLEHLLTRFSKRTRKGFYHLGKVQSEEDTQRPSLQLVRHADERGASIVKSDIEEDSDELPILRRLAVSPAKKKSEHSALDLFVHVCQRVPGLKAASSRETHPVSLKSVYAAQVAPIPFDGLEPPLKFDPPLLGLSQILPSEICNSLVLGSTGSGKTISFLQPALLAMLEYRIADKAAALLVIDPKVELLASIRQKLVDLGELDRLVVIGECPPVQFFQDNDDLALSDRFAIARQFVAEGTHGDEGRWAAMADRLIISLLRDSELFGNAVGVGLLESMAAIVTGDASFYARNEWVALRQVLMLGMESSAQVAYLADLYDTLCFSIGLTKIERPLARYAAIKDEDQYFYNARGALLIADLLGGDEIESLLDMSVRRTANKKELCQIADLIDRGAVIVFQPRPKATHDLVGAALKSAFFRCTMQRKDMNRPIGLVYDEAQRFITTDEETGEHTFLDRCRAYKVITVMATQSIAALQAAVASKPGSRGALESILVNTPTKVCFRTNDVAALQVMKGFIPGDPSGAGHVLQARPPSTLRVGECYFSLGHTWGRTRYHLANTKISAVEGKPLDTHKEAA